MTDVDVYLDVDGVILPVVDPADRSTLTDGGFREWVPVAGRPEMAAVDMLERLEALAARPGVHVHWCTAWGTKALSLAAGLGLPEWPVIDADNLYRRTENARYRHHLNGTSCSCGEWEARLGESIRRAFDRHLLDVAPDTSVGLEAWWKRDAVQAHHAERPGNAIVWCDDDLPYDGGRARDWLLSLGADDRGLPYALPVFPRTTVGLSVTNFERIEDFVDLHVAGETLTP